MMPRTKKLSGKGFILLAAVATFLFLLPGCNRQPKAGQLLRIGLEAEPVTLDPHLNAESATWTVLGNIFEGLVGFDREMRIIPLLATHWENPDDNTWLFHLRRDVIFHNSQKMKASDVVFSLERARDKPQSKVGGAMSSIAGIEAVGDQAVLITTHKPNPVLLNKLTSVFIVPRHYYENNGDSIVAVEPVGSGPYKLEKWEQKKQALMTRNESYYGKKPKISKALFIEVASRESRVQALLSGKVDIIRNLPAESFGEVNSSREFKVIISPGLMVSYLGMDMSGKCKPFLDAQVRKAIYLGINVEKIIDTEMNGYGTPAGQLTPPGIFGYNPSIDRARYNPVEARALMKASRYPDGFTVKLDIPENAISVGEALRADLEKIGIKVKLAPSPWRQFYKKITEGQSAFYLVGWDCTSGDASDIYNACLHSPDTKQGYGSANIGRYSSSRMDSLIEESNQLLASSERQASLQQIMSLAMKDLPLIPLYMQDNYYGVRKEVNWQPRLDERIYVSDMEFITGEIR